MTNTLVFRPGAYGDGLMASSTFPGLVQQGRRLTFMTSFQGEEICRHDPHLYRVRVLPEQYGEQSFGAAIAELSHEYEDVIVLSGAVEWRLLPRAEQPEYFWPEAQRRRMFGGSYLAHLHQLAGVPPPFRVTFYPTVEERAWADAQADAIGRPFVLWSLRGSQPHKVYPHVAEAACQVLARADVAIVFVGDDGCADMEQGILDQVQAFYGDVRRMFSLVGVGTMRRVCALAQRAAVVVGPETGVLNAVSFEPMPKVALLSHSAPSNLTDDWVNTRAITPQVPCYPCHRLHRDFSYCPQDERTLLAKCATSVRPHQMAARILEAVCASS